MYNFDDLNTPFSVFNIISKNWTNSNKPITNITQTITIMKIAAFKDAKKLKKINKPKQSK